MSGQKIHSFRYAYLFLGIFLLAPLLSAVAAPPENQAGLQTTGWPGDRFQGPIWWKTALKDASRKEAILEVEDRQLFVSAVFEAEYLELYAGRRELPARSSFYSDGAYPPGFLPARRRDDLIFARPALWFFPGIFALKGISGPGLYLRYRNNLFLAYHPASRLWAVTTRLHGKRTSVLLDVEGEKKEFQGYASLAISSEGAMSGSLQRPESKMEQPQYVFRLTTERRPIWDGYRYREERYDSFDEASDGTAIAVVPERRYRSMTLVMNGGLGPLSMLSGGMDRGDVAYRIVTVGRRVPPEPGWYALIEGSLLQMQIYREDLVRAERRLGLGLAMRGRRSLFEWIIRAGDAPSLGLEIRGRLQDDTGLMVQPVLLLSDSVRADTFEYLSGVEVGEGQTGFHDRIRYAFGLRLRSESVRAVVLFTGRHQAKGGIREWGYLRLEYRRQF